MSAATAAARTANEAITAPVLSVRHLDVSFQVDGTWRQVVRDVSFDIAPRETLAIVGESGSGKSVTSLAIMRLLPKNASKLGGRIILDGRDTLSLPEPEMRNLRGPAAAMIFQEPMTSLNPLFTIGDQISEALYCHQKITGAEARAETIRLLEKVRMPAAKSRFDDYPHQFSGGMRQRVMIAMALASKPKLLIADEPTTALDVTIQGQILDLIKVLQDEEGMAVLFITHDMGVVADVADRTLVMFRGQSVETGRTAELFPNPLHPYTKALLSAVPRLGSMSQSDRPKRFPIIDPVTGIASVPVEMGDTVVQSRQPLLEVHNLTTRFDVGGGWLGGAKARVHAVENVSFTINAGETLALVGESGCGKSTTGRSIARLVEPTDGDILLDGFDILKMTKRSLLEARRKVQMIFQDPFSSLNPRMSVGAAIAEPLLFHRVASRRDVRDRVAELLRSVGLDPDMAERYPHEFSGGQRQRICIARVLGLEPKLIIADESVSALDVSVKAQVVNLLLDLQDRLGIAFLFISHDMAVVERVSHRIAVMYLGEIVEIGPRAAVFDNPQHAYTRKLIAAVPVPDPAVRRSRNMAAGDIVSPVRPIDYVVPQRRYLEVSPGHLVRDDAEQSLVA